MAPIETYPEIMMPPATPHERADVYMLFPFTNYLMLMGWDLNLRHNSSTLMKEEHYNNELGIQHSGDRLTFRQQLTKEP